MIEKKIEIFKCNYDHLYKMYATPIIEVTDVNINSVISTDLTPSTRILNITFTDYQNFEKFWNAINLSNVDTIHFHKHLHKFLRNDALRKYWIDWLNKTPNIRTLNFTDCDISVGREIADIIANNNTLESIGIDIEDTPLDHIINALKPPIKTLKLYQTLSLTDSDVSHLFGIGIDIVRF